MLKIFENQFFGFPDKIFDFSDFFSQSLHTKRFLIEDYQWISCLVLVFLGLFVDFSVWFLLSWAVRLLRKDSQSDDTEADRQAERKVWKPIGLLMQATTWYFCCFLIGFPIAEFLTATARVQAQVIHVIH